MNPDDPRDPSIDDAYRATKREEPPLDLDERILAAAHRAVAARPSPVRRSFAQRWRVPVAIAATVVLSGTVTLMVYESDRTTPFQKREVLDKIREESAPPASPPVPRAAGKPAAERAAQPSRGDAQTAAPRPATGDDETGAARAPAAQGALRQSGPPEAESPTANEAKRGAAPFPAEPAAARVPPATQTPQSPGEQRSLVEKRAAPAPTPAPAAAPSLSRERELADRPAGRSERGLAPANAQSRLESPDDWFAEIRRLKQTGRVDEANRLIAEFRERFPDHSLPEDLR